MSEVKKKNKKQRLVQLIHIGKNKVGLSDDDYREVLIGATEKDSCTKMTETDLEASLKAIKALGFKVKRISIAGKATAEQLSYIRILWQSSARVKTEDALNAFIKKITGVAHLSWLEKNQGKDVILALRKMATKAGLNPDNLPI